MIGADYDAAYRALEKEEKRIDPPRTREVPMPDPPDGLPNRVAREKRGMITSEVEPARYRRIFSDCLGLLVLAIGGFGTGMLVERQCELDGIVEKRDRTPSTQQRLDETHREFDLDPTVNHVIQLDPESVYTDRRAFTFKTCDGKTVTLMPDSAIHVINTGTCLIVEGVW